VVAELTAHIEGRDALGPTGWRTQIERAPS
jgi:hypothetical protein